MLNKDYITTEVERLFSMLDAEELPQTHHFLAGIMDDEGFVIAAPYEIASNLVECDKPHELPDVLVDFITDMFETAIASLSYYHFTTGPPLKKNRQNATMKQVVMISPGSVQILIVATRKQCR